MARVGIEQASFISGELTPRLFGRTDFARYASGAEKIENFIVRPEGGIIRRHGTRYGGETKDSTRQSILVPFIVSDIQPYMLEFGNLYIRPWKNNVPIAALARTITAATKTNPVTITVSGGTLTAGQHIIVTGVNGMGQLNNREFVVSGTGSTVSLTGVNGTGYDTYVSGGVATVPFEIVSPYTEAELATIFTTQSADTLYIMHPNHPPQTLVRVTDTNWTFGTVPQSKGPWATLNTDVNKMVYCITSSGNYDPGDAVTVVSNVDLFDPGHAGSYLYMEEIHFADNAVYPYGTDRANNNPPGVGDQYSNAGNVYECVQAIGDQLSGQIPPVHSIGEAWDGPQGSKDIALWRYLHSRWGIISLDTYTDARHMTGKIVTRLPNGLSPTSSVVTACVGGTAGIRLTSSNHSYGVGDWVIVLSMPGVPNAVGNWRVINVTQNTFELEGSTFAGALTSNGQVKRFATHLYRYSAFSNSRGWPKTVAIHEQRLCYANTTQQPFGFWASASGDYYNHLPGKAEDDEAIQYNIAGNQVDPVRWLMASNQIVLGTLSSELAAYGGGLGDPITPSNTRIVPQSGEGSNATPPTKAGGAILFVNRSGRKLFSLDYRAQFDQYVADDLIEIASHLAIGKTIIRLAWAKNPLSVLWVLFSDGTMASVTYRPDQQVVAWARHPVANSFIESIAVIPSNQGTTDELWMIVRRTINGVAKRYIEYLARPFEPVSPTDKTLMGFVDCGFYYTGTAISTITGLFPLEGQTLQLVSNGARHRDLMVTNGKITLDAPTTNLWAGLGYTTRLTTLRPEQGAQVTAQGKVKRIPRLTVRVMNTIGGQAGPYDESVMDALVPTGLVDPNDPASPMFTGDNDVTISTDYALDGRIAILQSEPMPLDILSVMPLISVSEG